MEVVLAVIKTYWLQLVLIAAGIAVGFLTAWHLQGIRLDSLEVEFGTYRLAVEQQSVIARAEALKQKEQWIKEKEDAQNAAAQREASLKAELSRTRRAADGLRDTLTELRERVSTSSLDACRATADTIAAVLGQCQARVGELAEQADGHASDVQTLTEAWPQ